MQIISRACSVAMLVVAPLVSPALRAQSSSPAQRQSDMGHGVSLALARVRSASLQRVHYNLQLDITARDSAVGVVAIGFERSGAGNVVVDFRGRRLTKLAANGRDLALSAFNGNHIRVDAAVLRSGTNEIRAEFVSEISATGASIIRAHDADGSDYVYTLLVPADANQLFPCFDQPDLKARVTLSLTTPVGWTAVANGSIGTTDSTPGRVVRRFTETRPLSTYLVAFAAGPFARISSSVEGRAINLYVRRSRAREVDADTLLALSHRALRWMERYFDRPYPFEKFDIMLAPAFPFGGMEHPGVVMYNEDRFIFRERPTLPRRLGRFSTILHETAHQWFGDLVTMRWFDDLWLKEGFATYMAAKALNDLEPNSDAWKVFYLGNKPSAYGVDQTAGTTPLWQHLANLDQAKSAYGAIVYNKAPGVLKQLNYLVGEDGFRNGVRLFLTRHAYANATWRELLGAVGEASGRQLDAFGTNFMLRPGMPTVESRVLVRDGKVQRLALVQRPVRASVSGVAPWPMRTQVVLRYADKPAVLLPVSLDGEVTEVPAARGLPAPLFVFPNADDYGYFLSLLDTASVRALESGAFASVSDGFLRSMLWVALWDQVREARMDPSGFARLILRELPNESDEQVLPGLLARLERVVRAYLSPTEQNRILPDAERLLWTNSRDTEKTYGARKAFLDAYVALAATSGGIAGLRALLVADSAAGEPMRDPARWEIVNRLLVLDDRGADAALAKQAARDTTPDGRRRAFVAGVAHRSGATKAEYFRRYFSDTTLNEDWASGSLGAFNSIEHQDLSLRFLRPALDSLPYIQANRRIFFLGSWLSAFLGGQTSSAAAAVVREYLMAHPRLPADLRQKVLQNADELDRTVRIRRRWG